MVQCSAKVAQTTRKILKGLAERLLHLQLHRAHWVLLVIGLTVVAALVTASRLELRTEFSAMLPDGYPSVREYHRVTARLPWASKVLVVLEGTDPFALRHAGDLLVTKIKAAQLPSVVSTEDGVREARKFLLPRALMYLDTQELQRLASRIDDIWNQSVAKVAGLDLEIDDEPSLQAVDLNDIPELGRLRSLVDHYPEGYFQSTDGRSLVVVVQTSLRAGEIAAAERLLDSLRKLVSGEMRNHDVHVGYAGDLVTGLQEYGAVRNDLLEVGVLGLSLILLAIVLYYRHWTALVALSATITAGCAWTFAAARLFIGHLNVATGFLFSIVAGNGINFAIIVLGRYFEELRKGQSVAEAIRVARGSTWRATLTAALAAAAAYASLWVSDFRGLKHFAVIGAIGMILCWLATFLLLPSVLVGLNPRRSNIMGGGQLPPSNRRGLPYEAPFAWLVGRAPLWVVACCVLTLFASCTAVLHTWGRDVMEYDMKQLFNQMVEAKEQKRLSMVGREVIGVANESSMAILCDRRDQVGPLSMALRQRWLDAPNNAKPFEVLHTVDDFVPSDQMRKIPLTMHLRDRLFKAYERGLIAQSQWDEWSPYLPTNQLVPFGIDELPESVARPFAERDGQRGRIVYIEPTHGADEDDVHYLMRWADSFRETRLPNGEVLFGSGRVVIFADMLAVVLHDMPHASYLSFLMTAIVVIVTNRRPKDWVLILFGLLTGVLWLAGVFSALQLKLNFLNFIALPITFGIGVDYAVNVTQRYREAPDAGPVAALRSSGGAVILCSLTTSLGYIALVGSKNQAVHSLGLLAVLGEASCLLAAVLLVPSVVAVTLRRRIWKSRDSVGSTDEPDLMSATNTETGT